jgi:hypothetical protein
MSAGIFFGNKERQRMSVYRPFKGDYLGFSRGGVMSQIKKKFAVHLCFSNMISSFCFFDLSV